MHNGPTLKTTWYEKLAWNVCPWIYYKIRGIREKHAKELEMRCIFKIVNEAFLERLIAMCVGKNERLPYGMPLTKYEMHFEEDAEPVKAAFAAARATWRESSCC